MNTVLMLLKVRNTFNSPQMESNWNDCFLSYVVKKARSPNVIY